MQGPSPTILLCCAATLLEPPSRRVWFTIINNPIGFGSTFLLGSACHGTFFAFFKCPASLVYIFDVFLFCLF